MTKPNPVLVEITRGTGVESVHRGSAVVAKSDGSVVAAWGDAARPVFPRSAVKPIQAMPMIETGAADHYGVSDQEIALACASHGGEPVHVRLVSAWLRRLGLGDEDLVCGPHAPLSEDAARSQLRAGETPCRVHNNCSGKHAGFLTTALHIGESHQRYADPESTVQQGIREMLSHMGECDLSSATRGIDGCGVPVIALPLRSIALAMARLGKPDGVPRARAMAANRVVAAMTAHPHLVAGQARFETDIMEKNPGVMVIKGGAEGVMAAAIPAFGLGFAVKVDDGAKRAAETAMAALISRFPGARGVAVEGIETYLERRIHNAAGDCVGVVRAGSKWLSPHP